MFPARVLDKRTLILHGFGRLHKREKRRNAALPPLSKICGNILNIPSFARNRICIRL